MHTKDTHGGQKVYDKYERSFVFWGTYNSLVLRTCRVQVYKFYKFISNHGILHDMHIIYV